MSAALVLMLLTAEPQGLPAAATATVEQAPPAARWPAAFFFIGGGVTLWTGVGMALGGTMDRCRSPCPSPTPLTLLGSAVAGVGVASLLVGIMWLVWTRPIAASGT